MPKISKIRIAGLKYESMKKQYEDLTFNFANENEATNALISLVNGGGKGVLLQTIFQLLKPGTSWGKENNRLYQHFFFNEQEKFVPYSFHVAIQWELDGDQKEQLITGGIFSAEKKVSPHEDENDFDIKPVLSFYSKKGTEELAVEDIPLTKTDELKSYFSENQYDVYKDRAKHYRILETYRIDRKDWDIIKDINKDEGGVGKYFDKAEDDYTLFQRKIVPIISQVLNKNEDENNDLIGIFRSQASIAKDLPILLQREQAHKEFLEEIVPFEDIVQKGIDQQQLLKENEQKGQRLVGALQHVMDTEKTALAELEQDLDKMKEQVKTLLFEQDNLTYLQREKEVAEVENVIKEHVQQIDELKNRILQQEESIGKINLQIALKEWQELNRQTGVIQGKIDKLEQSADLTEINDKMKELKSLACEKWTNFEEEMKQDIGSYQSLMHKLESQKQTFISEKEKAVQKIAESTEKINQAVHAIQLFKSNEKEMIEQYGEKIVYDIDGVLMKEHKKQNEQLNQKDQNSQKQQLIQEKRRERSNEIGAVKEKMTHAESKKQELEKRVDMQRAKEQTLQQHLFSLFNDEIDEMNASTLTKYTQKVEDYALEIKEKLETSNRELWELQLNSSLNDQAFWIANHDVKQAKEILEKSINVTFGSEYMTILSETEKKEMLAKNPLLPFGLVVVEKEWNKFDQKIMNHKVFQTPVPIFIREHMEDAKHVPFHLLQGKEQTFMMDDSSFASWKASFETKVNDIRSVIEEYKKTDIFVGKVKQHLLLLSSGALSIDIEKEVEKEVEIIQALHAQLSELLTKEAQEKNELTMTMEQSKQMEKNIQRQTEAIRELKSFKQDQEHYQKHVNVKEVETNKIEQVNKEKQETEKLIENTEHNIEAWKNSYLTWKHTCEHALKTMQTLLPAATFPSNQQGFEGKTKPTFSTTKVDELQTIGTEFDYLQKTKEHQNAELIRLKVELEHEEKAKNKKEKALKALRTDWKNILITDETLEVLTLQVETEEKQVQENRQNIQLMNEKRAKSEGILETKKQLKEEAEKKVMSHNRPVVHIENVNFKEEAMRMKEELQLCQSEIKEASKLKEEVEDSIGKYENNQKNLTMIIDPQSVPFEQKDIDEIKKNSDKAVINWKERYNAVKEESEKINRKAEFVLTTFKNKINEKDWETKFKHSILLSLNQMQVRYYENIKEKVEGMKKFSTKSLDQLDKDKERAEQAQEYWASRAAMKVMSISEAIRSMISRMKINNELGSFPLVKLKEDDILPKKPEDIENSLKEHFVSSIKKITKKFDHFNQEDESLMKEIKEMVGDQQILFVALRHRYPTLLVYNMKTENAFTYGRPKKEHYSTWKTINAGSETKSDGSGGQKLSARMIVMMMLLSVKNDSDHNWTPLLCDNPFGQAASEHVLNPIFAVAEKLKFQLIIVTPPELVKTEISNRFPVYYKLDFTKKKGKETISEAVQYSFRKVYE